MAGIAASTDQPLDSKNIHALREGGGAKTREPCFCTEGGSSGEWAVRSGDWKLVAIQNRRELFNLASDPFAASTLAGQQPGKLAELSRLYDAWLDQMTDPMQGHGKRWARALLRPRRRPRTRRSRARTRSAEKTRGEMSPSGPPWQTRRRNFSKLT